MENFKEILRCRIEQVLDEGFAKHIPLTSEYLAEKLLAVPNQVDGEPKQMERYQAARILSQCVVAHQKIEQYTAMSLAAMMLLDPVQYLSSDELRHAYVLQQHEYDKEDIRNELDLSEDEYCEKFDIGKKHVTEEEIDRMATVLRKILDSDADANWSDARKRAVITVLEGR